MSFDRGADESRWPRETIFSIQTEECSATRVLWDDFLFSRLLISVRCKAPENIGAESVLSILFFNRKQNSNSIEFDRARQSTLYFMYKVAPSDWPLWAFVSRPIEKKTSTWSFDSILLAVCRAPCLWYTQRKINETT